MVECRDQKASLIELRLNAFTARSFAMFLADLCAAEENPLNQAGD